MRHMSATLDKSFLDQVIGPDGVVEPDRLSSALRITKGELAVASGAGRCQRGVLGLGPGAAACGAGGG